MSLPWLQILTGSNWHEVMYSAVWSTNNWAYGFLLMFVWAELTLVLMNLVVSLVIESYNNCKDLHIETLVLPSDRRFLQCCKKL